MMPSFPSLLLTACLACTAIGWGRAQDAAEQPAAVAKTELQLPWYPLDIALQPDGTAYVVDRNMHGVWKWKDDALSVFFQGSNKFRTPLNAPRCVAMEKDGTLLVGDSATRDIYRISADGKAEPITGGGIGIPMDLAVKSDGTIYVADAEMRSLFRIPPGENKAVKVAAVNPRGVFVDAQDRVWVVSQDAEQLLIVSDDGSTEKIVSQRIFEFPHQVVVDSKGTAYVTDGYKQAVWQVDPGSPPKILFQGPPLDNPVGIALLDDTLIVVDPRARKVFRFDDQGKPQVYFEIKN